MSVESKLDQLIKATGQIASAQAANQTAVLNAIQNITPGNNQAITDALAQIEGQVTEIHDTLGTEAPVLPAVTGLSPNNGPVAGGTGATISGSGFKGATAVNFGGVAATSFSVTDDNTISAVAPAGAAVGAVDVTVVTPSGTSATSSADQYTYA